MTQQIINTGLVANDGTGESLRAAFDAVNNNFTAIWSSGPVDSNVVIANNTVTVRGYNNELILQANGIGNIQVNSTINPGISGVYDLGTPDKLFGSVRAQYFYGNGAFLTGISGGGGGSQVTFSQFAPNPANIGDVWIESDTGVQYIYFSDNTSNQWAEMEAYQSFSSSGGTYGNANVVANLASLGTNPVSTTGNVTAGYFLGNGSQLTGLAATYGNANVVANLAALGSNPVSTTGNITAGYLFGNGSQLTGLAATYGNANVVANLAALGSNPVSTTGNVTAGYFLGNGSQLTGLAATYGNSNVATLLAGFGSNTISTTSNITGGNILTGGLISATGNVSGNYFIGNGSQLTGIAASYGNANVATFLAAYGSNTVSTTGNITGGNLLTGGLISATGNITAGNNVFGANLYTNGRIQGYSLDILSTSTLAVVITGGLTANTLTSNGTVSASGAISGASLSVTGNVTGGNVLTGGLISSTGNITGGNISATNHTGTTVSVSGNVTSGNVVTGGLVSATATVTGGNLATGGTASATGNITGGNVLTAGLISATGNITGGNILATNHTGTTVSVTGNITAANFFGNGNTLSNVATRFESAWTVPVGNSTQSFTVAASETYYMWVDCNIPNGILVWNATATVTNTNVPVVGQQFAWVYSGGGTPIDFTSIPNQFIGTANAIVRSSTAPSTTTNRFDFGINNTSAGNVTVRYGWVAIS